MLKNYFKTAWRNLVKNKTFSLINILGLGLGIACTLFIYLWVQDEKSYDNFHANGDRLYRVMINDKDKNGNITNTMDATPGLLADALKKQVPEITGAAMVVWDNDMLVAVSPGRIYRFNDCNADDQFPGNKSGDSKPGEEFKNRING